MTNQWYMQIGDGESGPYSSSDLRRMAHSGKLHQNSLIRSSDSERWYLAEKITGLFPQTRPGDTEEVRFRSAAPKASSTSTLSEVAISPSLSRDLIAGEDVIATARVHPLIFVTPVIISVLTVLVVLPLLLMSRLAEYEEQRTAGRIVAYAFFGLGTYLTLRAVTECVLIYKCNALVLTNQRLIGRRGFFSVEKTNILLRQIETVQVREPFIGRLFNFGTIVVGGTGSGRIMFKGVEGASSFQKITNERVIGARS